MQRQGGGACGSCGIQQIMSGGGCGCGLPKVWGGKRRHTRRNRKQTRKNRKQRKTTRRH